jgi:hypothetical protein
LTAVTAEQASVVDATTGVGVAAGPRRSPTGRPWWRQWRTGDWAVDLACLSVALMGFNRWRVADYPLSDFVFVAAAAVISLRLLTGRGHTLAPAESRRSSVLVLCGALIMLTAGTLSSFGAWNPLASIGIVLRLAWLTLIWFWILRSVTTDREVFNRLLGAWRFALVLNASLAALGELGIMSISAQNAENRQTAFFGHPNDLAGFLVVGVPLIVLGLPRAVGPVRGSTLWRLTTIGLVAFAIATTGSMSAVVGAIVGAAVTVGVLVVTRNPRRTRRRHPLFVMTLVAAVSIGLVLLSTSDLPLVSRITELGQGGSGVNESVSQRGVRNQYVLDRMDELLVVGIGLDHESLGKITNALEDRSTRDEIGIHNMYLKVLLESGFPALIGLWLIVGTTLLMAWRLMLNTRNDTLHATTAALFGATVTINVFAMFQPTLFHRFYWYPVAMIGALWALRRQELRQTGRQAAPVPERPGPLPFADISG